MSGREILKSKFQEELAEFVSALRHGSVEDAIDQAGLFAAMNIIFQNSNAINETDAEYFIEHESPLRGLAEYYMNREFDREAFADMAAGIADRDLLAE